jgi:hypothetical protein
MNEELNDDLPMFPHDATDEVAEVETESEELPEVSAGSEPETETNTEDQPKTGNKLQERLDKLTAERYAEKRRADELAAKLAELERQKPVAQPEDMTPPELPDDPFDTDAMRKYHADMVQYSRKVAAFEAKQALSLTANEQKATQQQLEQQKMVQTFAKRTIESGLTIEQIEQAGTALVNAGMPTALQELLLEDEAGPQITMYLAKNPDEALELLSLPTHKAAVAIATKIKAKAVTTKAKATKAPDPIPESRGVSLRDDDELERKFKNAQFI